MNRSAHAIAHALEDRLDVARSLLDDYAAAAKRGLAALSAHDLDGLEAALEARQQVIPELEPLLSSLEKSWRSGARPRSEVSDFHELARATQKLDSKLTVALGAELQRVSQEIGLLDDEEAVRSAYGQTSPHEGRTINLVR